VGIFGAWDALCFAVELVPPGLTYAQSTASLGGTCDVGKRLHRISLVEIASAVASICLQDGKRRSTPTIARLALGLEPLRNIVRSRVTIVVTINIVSEGNIIAHVVVCDARCRRICKTVTCCGVGGTGHALASALDRVIVEQHRLVERYRF